MMPFDGVARVLGFLSCRPIWDSSPTPSDAVECVPPPPFGSGEKTLAGRRGGGGLGGPNSNEGKDTVVGIQGIYVLCGEPKESLMAFSHGADSNQFDAFFSAKLSLCADGC
jgi:hypothetical protein